MERKIKRQGKIFVISGPSGSGKTTLAARILKDPGLKGALARSVSLTTRPKRRGERDKKDYFFITGSRFKELLKAKKILEWTRYLGYYYATPKEFVDSLLSKGRHVVLCLDNKGAKALKSIYPGQVVTIFVKPPSLAVLKNRIENRCNRTTRDEICNRLTMARREMKLAGRYDHWVLNDDLQAGVKELKKIILKKIK